MRLWGLHGAGIDERAEAQHDGGERETHGKRSVVG